MPGSRGEEHVEPTVSTMGSSSRGPRTIRILGSRGERHLAPTVATMRPSLRGSGAVRTPGSRGEGTIVALGAQQSVHRSDVLPVSAVGGMGGSNVPSLGIHLVRKVPGWRPLRLVFGADP